MRNDTARLLKRTNPFAGDKENERRAYRTAKKQYNKADWRQKTRLRAAMIEMVAAQKVSESMTEEVD